MKIIKYYLGIRARTGYKLRVIKKVTLFGVFILFGAYWTLAPGPRPIGEPKDLYPKNHMTDTWYQTYHTKLYNTVSHRFPHRFLK
jgi:hypothetical protein